MLLAPGGVGVTGTDAREGGDDAVKERGRWALGPSAAPLSSLTRVTQAVLSSRLSLCSVSHSAPGYVHTHGTQHTSRASRRAAVRSVSVGSPSVSLNIG